MSLKQKIRVGSRKSELALIQTKHVISLLESLFDDKEFEIVTMSTLGDKVLDIPLPKIGEKSLFTKELETALANGFVDFVVHSLKDLPTTLPPGMAICAVIKREDPRDALVLQKDLKNKTLLTLPEGSVVGTSSLRRSAQIHRKYPHLVVQDIRGNLNTRLRKLDDLNEYQAIVLAMAGLQRMGWDDRITQVLDTEDILYAVGQGALAVECCEENKDIINLFEALYDPQTALTVISERAFLKTLGGGCSAPVAIVSNLTNIQGNEHKLSLKGGVWSLDGKDEIIDTASALLDLKAECPYKNIELQNNSEPCTKKMKVEQKEIPLDLLKTNPHVNCPFAVPVGSDFMGQCPYLEAEVKNHVNVDIAKTGCLDIKKCPYFKDNEMIKNTLTYKHKESGDTATESNLYCGLVPHVKLTKECLDKAQDLGVQLAEKVTKRGALDIMSKAQKHIRGA